MKNAINHAKELLAEGFTCVVTDGETVYTSCERGVKPLVSWYVSHANFTDCAAADKVVGRATAFLYLLLGVRRLHARVISESALALLCDAEIEVSYDLLVPHIRNRAGDGICPFEEAVKRICDPQDAYHTIRAKMAELHIEI